MLLSFRPIKLLHPNENYKTEKKIHDPIKKINKYNVSISVG